MEVNTDCFPVVKEEMEVVDTHLHTFSNYVEKDRSSYDNKILTPFENKSYDDKLPGPYIGKTHNYETEHQRLYEAKKLELLSKPIPVSAPKALNGKEHLTCSPDFVQELAILTELSQQLQQKDKLHHLRNNEVQHRVNQQSGSSEILNLRNVRQDENHELSNENVEERSVGSKTPMYEQGAIDSELVKSDLRNCRKKFECEDCHKNFPSKIKLHVHVKAHSEEEKLQCDVCQMRFAHKTGYTRHIRSHNKSNSCTDEGLLPNRNSFSSTYNSLYNNYNSVYGGYGVPYNSENPVPNSDSWSQCDVCKSVFISKLDFNKHKRTHFQPKERLFKCNECQKSFVSRSSLSTHEKSHRSERNFKCEDCGISFHRKYFLRQHSKIHSGKKIYTCPECCHNFTTKLALNVHTRIHTGEKPYECNYCGKSFTCKFYLDTHIRTHTGEKPFKCEICEKCFSQKSTLNTHKRLHARYNNTDSESQ